MPHYEEWIKGDRKIEEMRGPQFPVEQKPPQQKQGFQLERDEVEAILGAMRIAALCGSLAWVGGREMMGRVWKRLHDQLPEVNG